MQKIVLASTSPRRIELMKTLGIPFEKADSKYDESRCELLDPLEHVLFLSEHKALAVKHNFPGYIIIGADTEVIKGNRIYGKPENDEHAFEMLHSLSGTDHKVITALTLLNNHDHSSIVSYEETKVHMRKLSDLEINCYIATGEPMDKAGAYAIQGGARMFVERIEGEYDNVVGLPRKKLVRFLREYGIQCIDPK